MYLLRGKQVGLLHLQAHCHWNFLIKTTFVNACKGWNDDLIKILNFVDNFDQLKDNYQVDRKSKKWYLRLFFHFVDVALTNSFILHQ